MTPSRPAPLSRFFVAIAAAASLLFSSALIAADAARPAAKKLRMNFSMDAQTEPLDPAAVHFGEVIFDYYTGRNFNAVTNLLIARDRGVLSGNDDYSEMLLGDLYTSFGLFEDAERIFSSLINRDILTKTRNETWFHTAELQYNQGRYDEAARILENHVTDLTPAMEKSRLIMLGNIYVTRGEFQRATELLANMKADDILGAYALYNAGVAFIRAGEDDRGMVLLQQVRDLPPGDEETNALKDRAAIAMGFRWLQKEAFDQARASLVTVRTDGPFTNQAMLGLGYANFQRNDFKRALPPWLELLQRNTSDTSVQEALMLAPRAYEELGAQPQALFGYRYAADTLRDELKKVERTIIRIRNSDWIDSLNPETAKDVAKVDPLAPVRGYTPARIPEAPYLYNLFASKEFSEDYKVYLELKRVERLLDLWNDQIPMYGEMLNRHRATLAPLRQQVDESTARATREVAGLRAQTIEVQSRVERAIRENDLVQTASLEQLGQLERVQMMEAQTRSGAHPAIAERLRRVRGLVLWDIAHHAPRQQQQALKDLVQLKLDTDNAQLHVDALLRLREDITLRMGPAYDRKLVNGSARITSLKVEVTDRLQQQVLALQNRALAVLAENRRNLGAQLAETHLSIARLQDSSVSDVIEKRKNQ
ncbi:MAG: tetratricopeptide repeat protein [Gammaproteobacteria bacterium]